MDKVNPQNMPLRPIRNLVIPSDTAGTGFYRFLQAAYTMYSGPESLPMVDISHVPPANAQAYENIDTVMVQRLIDPQQLQYVKFLKQVSEVNGMRVIYNIDDAMGRDDIPLWNRGRRAFLAPERQAAIKEMLSLADQVLVTTDYLKTYYNRNYDVPLDNIVCIPNLLPRWWIDGKLDVDKKAAVFKQRKAKGKMRVGIVSSLSHYNIDGILEKDGKAVFCDKLPDGTVKYVDEDGKEVDSSEALALPKAKDEMDEICDLVESTADVFEWTIVGWVNDKLKALAQSGKIAVVPAVPILNYPQLVQQLELDVWVVPCRPDLEFNKCKSNIKWLEACALGIPMLAQKVKPTYVKYMPGDQLWETPEELKSKLLEISQWSVDRYKSVVESQRKFIDSPAKECGIELRNWWMEDNLQIWSKVWSQPQRMTPAKQKYIDEMQKKLQPREEDIIFKSESGDCMIVK